MKIHKREARQIAIKLEATRMAIEKAQESSFLKESCFDLLERAKKWVEDVEEMVGTA